MKITSIFLFLLFNTSNLFSQEVFVSSKPINYTYLVFSSSLSEANKTTTITTLVTGSKNNSQPSARFFMFYNSSSTLSKFSDYGSKDGYFKTELSTNRALITIFADNESVIKTWESAGKIKKISCLYEKIYSDNKKGLKNAKTVVTENYIDYPMDYKNKDWCLYVIDTSTPIK